VPPIWKEPALQAIRKGLTSTGSPATPPPRPAEGSWGCTGFGPYPSVMELAGAIEAWVVAGRLTPAEFTVSYAQSQSPPAQDQPATTLFTAIVTWQRSG
jgi:hypothetical protein